MYFSEKLKKFKNIKHCFFSKNNGFSKGIYSTLNCGKGSKDNQEDVLKNLKYVSKLMAVPYKNLILMHQSHSNKVLIIDEKNKEDKNFFADAIITKLKGVALGVLTADCVPIILFDYKNNIIGCIHAGWKGALSGVIENTIDKFKELSNNNDIIASIGPCIGKTSYEVDKKFYLYFLKEKKKNEIFFKKENNQKFKFDLRGYVQNKLKKMKVEEIDNINFDTFGDQANFFSYRRSQKLGEVDYGRCISTISLLKD